MMNDSYNWEERHKRAQPPAQIFPLPPTQTVDGATPYGAKALQEELYILANTGRDSHQRNHQLNKSAFNLAQLVAAGHLERVSTQQQLRSTAITIGLTVAETDATLRSAFNAGTQTPRIVPELPTNIETVDIQINPETGEAANPSMAANQTEVDRRYLQLEAQLLKPEGLRQLKPPTYLIDNWLVQDSLAWISGKPGDCKSFIALDMGCSVSTGLNWQGHTAIQGTVLYLAAEGAAGLAIRLDAWMKANKNPDENNLYFLPVPVKMIDTYHVDVQALMQLLKNIRPMLVIVDTQARVATGLEENSSKDMGKFVDALEALRAAWPATYLIVHHTPRNGENLRGSTALEAAAETIVRAVKDDSLVKLECQKQKNAAPPEDLEMVLTPLGDSAILSHEAVGLEGLIDHELGPKEKKLLEELWDQNGTSEVRSTEWQLKSELARNTHLRARDRLVKHGFLEKREHGNSTYYKLSPKGQSHVVPP